MAQPCSSQSRQVSPCQSRPVNQRASSTSESIWKQFVISTTESGIARCAKMRSIFSANVILWPFRNILNGFWGLNETRFIANHSQRGDSASATVLSLQDHYVSFSQVLPSACGANLGGNTRRTKA